MFALKGVVEGFYGKSWSWQARHIWLDILAPSGSCYIYASKSDAFLRQNWRKHWVDKDYAHIHTFAEACHKKSVPFGIGLSPYGCTTSHADSSDLLAKTKSLLALQPAIFCLLFDDIKADSRAAHTQIALTNLVQNELPDNCKLLLCPTWYSLDKRLQELYGAIPKDYFATLGANLSAEVGVLWTGEKVCSDQHNLRHWQAMSKLLQRSPVLWDNSISNDGKYTASFLALRAEHPQWRDLSALTDVCNGVLLNPNNQAAVAQLLWRYLTHYLGTKHKQSAFSYWQKLLSEHCSPTLMRYLLEDEKLFNTDGLDALNANQCNQYAQKYYACKEAIADDIADWFQKLYVFDPQCLT